MTSRPIEKCHAMAKSHFQDSLRCRRRRSIGPRFVLFVVVLLQVPSSHHHINKNNRAFSLPFQQQQQQQSSLS
jgi:hypothetical protein